VVSKGKADNLTAAVVPSEGVVVKGLILLRGTPKQVDFLRIEHAADECVAFLPVFSESIWGDGAACHKRSSYFGVSHCAQACTRTACDRVWRAANKISKWGLFVPRKIMSSGQAAADHRQPLPASTPESSPGYLAKLDALA
jgi:hypothetical protein